MFQDTASVERHELEAFEMIVIDLCHFSCAEIQAILRNSASLATVRVIDVVGHAGECDIRPRSADHDVGEPAKRAN